MGSAVPDLSRNTHGLRYWYLLQLRDESEHGRRMGLQEGVRGWTGVRCEKPRFRRARSVSDWSAIKHQSRCSCVALRSLTLPARQKKSCAIADSSAIEPPSLHK